MATCEKKTLWVLFIDEDEWQEIGLCYSGDMKEDFGFIIVNMANGNRELFKADQVKRIKLLERK